MTFEKQVLYKRIKIVLTSRLENMLVIISACKPTMFSHSSCFGLCEAIPPFLCSLIDRPFVIDPSKKRSLGNTAQARLRPSVRPFFCLLLNLISFQLACDCLSFIPTVHRWGLKLRQLKQELCLTAEPLFTATLQNLCSDLRCIAYSKKQLCTNEDLHNWRLNPTRK